MPKPRYSPPPELPDRGQGPSLAVIVPATDEAPTLSRCLGAIDAGTYVPDERIVARRPRGAGPAEARNSAAGCAAADVLVFVDADVEVHADALARLREAFARDPRLDAVFGAYDDRPAAPGAVSRFRNLLHHHVHATSRGPAQTFWAGLGAVRRETFAAAGGFDAGRFPQPSIEDVELGLRLRAQGRRIVLDPEIRGTHLKRWTLIDMVQTDLVRRGIPWTRLALDTGSVPTTLNLAWRHRASALACVLGVVALAARRPATASMAAATLVSLNVPFYALLARRGGPRLAVKGVALHFLHHLTAVAALAAGTTAHTLGRLR